MLMAAPFTGKRARSASVKRRQTPESAPFFRSPGACRRAVLSRELGGGKYGPSTSSGQTEMENGLNRYFSCHVTFALSSMPRRAAVPPASRSEEHTSELQSLMRISYAVFCLHNTKTHLKVITEQDVNTLTYKIHVNI